MQLSTLYTLDVKDLINGLFTAIGGSVVGLLYSMFQNVNEYGVVEIDWKLVGFAAITAGLGYLQKRYFSGSSGEVLER